MIAAFKYTLLAMVVGTTVIAGGNTVIASGNASASAADSVQIDGSRTVFPITKAMAATKYKNRELGTVSPGSEVGIGIEELMSREAKQAARS